MAIKEKDESEAVQASPAKQPVATKKKIQFELSDSDVEYLNKNMHSAEAWNRIGRKYRIDPATKEALTQVEYRQRGFIAEAKEWPKEEVKKVGGVLTSDGFRRNEA